MTVDQGDRRVVYTSLQPHFDSLEPRVLLDAAAVEWGQLPDFEPVGPLGSLVYHSAVEGTIPSVGQQDVYTTWLEAGQTLSAVLDVDVGFQVEAFLVSPMNLAISSASSGQAGADVLLDVCAVDAAGQYYLLVRGVGESTGAYTADVLLNSAYEQEAHQGASNDTRDTAQNIDGSFIDLGSGVARGAVTGDVGIDVAWAEDFSSGSLDDRWTTWSSSANGTVAVVASAGYLGNGDNALVFDRLDRDVFTLNEAIWRPELGEGEGMATLSFWWTTARNRAAITSFAGPFIDHANADGISISVDGTHWYPVFSTSDIGNSNVFRHEQINLSAVADHAGIELGPDLQIKFQQYGEFEGSMSWGDYLRFDQIELARDAHPLIAADSFLTERLGPTWSTYTSGGDAYAQADSTTHGSGPWVLRTGTRKTIEASSEATWRVDMSGVSEAMLSFSLRSTASELPFTGDFTGHEKARGIAVSSDGVNWHPVFDGPLANGGPNPYTAELAGVPFASQYQIRFQYYGTHEQKYMQWDDLVITGPSVDWYEFSAHAGQQVSIALAPRWPEPVNIQLYDQSGALLAEGLDGLQDVTDVIQDVEIASDGSYYIRVSSLAGSEYSLWVTKGATIDVAPSGDLAPPQNITPGGATLGAVGQSLGRFFGYTRYSSTPILWELDPYSGEVVRTTTPPVSPNPAYFAMATTPETLLFANVTEIIEWDPDTETVLRTIPAPAGFPAGSMAYLDNEIFLSGRDPSDSIYVLDYQSGALNRILNTSPGGMIAASSTALYRMVSESTYEAGLYEIDITDGSATRLFDLPVNKGLAITANRVLAHGYMPSENAHIDYCADLTSGEMIWSRNNRLELAPDLGGDGGYQPGPDRYGIAVNAGDELSVAVRRLFTGGGNNLDPLIDLYAPDGARVGRNDNADGGHDAMLTRTALQSGMYVIEVKAVSGEGPYLLSVAGNTGQTASLDVLAADIANGAVLSAPPAQITLDLSGEIRPESLGPGDLTVNGVPATGVTMLSADSVRFDLPVISEGQHVVKIVPGALENTALAPVSQFVSTFTIDLASPRIVSSSLQAGDRVSGTGLSIDIRFDLPLDAAGLDSSEFQLAGAWAGAVTPDAWTYDKATRTLALEYSYLADDAYSLSLYSGDGLIEGLHGEDLDGEATAWPVGPNVSGDGIEGGDFVVNFIVDTPLILTPSDFTPLRPYGSGIHEALSSGQIASPGQSVTTTLALDAGQTLTVAVTPAGTLRATVELRDSTGTLLASATVNDPGQTTLIQTVPIAGGTYQLTVTGADGTTGTFETRVLLNTSLDENANAGPLALAQDIDSSFIDLGGGVRRGAVLGSFQTDQTSPESYSFALAAGDSLSIGVASEARMHAHVALYDPAGQLMTRGLSGSTNFDEIITNFVVAADGTYFVQVAPDPTANRSGDHTLVVVRNASLDAEWNSAPEAAQDITAYGTVVGSVGLIQAGRLFSYEDGQHGSEIIFEIDPLTGDILTSFPGPVHEGGNEMGLANTGHSLLLAGVNSSTSEIRPDLDPADPAWEIRSFSAGLQNAANLVFLDGEMFYTQSEQADRISVIDYATGLWIRDITTQGVFAGTLAATASQLIGLGDDGVLYNVDPITGQMEARGYLGDYHALGVIDGELFAAYGGKEGAVGKIDVFDLETLSPQRTLTGYEYLTDLSAGGAERDVDYYSIQVNADDALAVTTRTPGAGALEPVNDLDPRVELYDPDGSIVARDDNSAPDGKNALLHYTAASGGVYTIAVKSVGGYRGDYVLNVAGYTALPAETMVISTDPVHGVPLNHAPRTMDVSFTRDVNLTSLDGSDLLVNGIAGVGHTVIDGHTVRFDLPAIGVGTFDVAIPAGSIVDALNRPVAGFTSQITVLAQSVLPHGSGAYSHETGGSISADRPESMVVLQLDGGQDLTLAIRPTSGLRPEITLRDPSGAVLATATSSPAGQGVVLEAIALIDAGDYTVTVNGAGGTEGEFDLHATLNAVSEHEGSTHLDNDTIASAQDMDPAFITLAGDGQIATVMGAVEEGKAILIAADGFESDALGARWSTAPDTEPQVRFDITGIHGAAAGDRALIMWYDRTGSERYSEAVWTVNLGGAQEVDLGFAYASNRLIYTQGSSQPFVFQGPFANQASATGIAISDDGANWYPVWDRPTEASETWQYCVLDLAETIREAELDVSGDVFIKFQSYAFRRATEWDGWDDIAIVIPQAADVYGFSLEAGQNATIGLSRLNMRSSTVELFDSSGQLLAAGTAGSANLDSAIGNFVAPETGRYYARITGGEGAEYSLVVTRQADINIEPNDSFDTAQDITLTGVVVGAAGTHLDRLFALDNPDYSHEVDVLLEIDPETGAVLSQHDFELDLLAGMARTSQTVLVLTSDGTTVYELDPDTFDTIRTLSVPVEMASADGLAYIQGEIYVSGIIDAGGYPFSHPGIVVMDYATGVHHRTLDGVNPAVFIGTPEGLLVASEDNLVLLDPVSGEVQSSRRSFLGRWGVANRGIAGMAVIGEDLYLTHWSIRMDGGISTFDLRTLDYVGETELPFSINGFGADLSFGEDWYRVAVNADDTLRIATSTPADGPLAFVNDLDPLIELYAPDGTLVVAADNNAPDGRNAQITHQAAVSGEYRIKVMAADRGGEYVLHVTGQGGSTAVPFVVDSTDPADQAVLTGVPHQMTVAFSQDIRLDTLAPSDLKIDGVDSTGLTLVDGRTVVFDLPSMMAGSHRATIVGGAILDSSSQTVWGFTSEFEIPFETQGIEPKGSLVYGQLIPGLITDPTVPAVLEMQLDAGQTITIVVHPFDGLKPTVELYGPDGSVLASATSTQAGKAVIIQTVPVSTAGQYTVSVASAGGAGEFETEILFNAAADTDANDGVTNNTLADAQDIDGSFIDLGARATRGAVVGGPDLLYGESFENALLGSEWEIYVIGEESAVTPMAFGGAMGGGRVLSMTSKEGMADATMTVDLSGVSSAELSFWYRNTDNGGSLRVPFVGHSGGTGVSISADGVNWYPIWQPARPQSDNDAWGHYVLDLGELATQAGLSFDADFGIRFQAGSSHYFRANWDDIRVSDPTAGMQSDTYSFTLNAGDIATASLSHLGLSDAEFAILAPNGQLLATSIPGDVRPDQIIENFVALEDGRYYLQIDATNSGGDYTAVITRNAASDIAPNNGANHPMDITPTGRVLGEAGTGIGRVFYYGDTYALREVDPLTGEVLNYRRIDLPWNVGTATTESTVLMYGEPYEGIVELDPNSFQIIRTIPGPTITFATAGGMAYMDNQIMLLHVDDLNDQVLEVRDYWTGELVRSVRPDEHVSTLGASSDRLFGGRAETLFEIDPMTGETTVLATLSHYIRNLGVSDGMLYISDGDWMSAAWYVYDLETLTLQETLDVRVTEAIAADEGVVTDHFEISVQVGDDLTISTATPAGGAGLIANDLDPMVELYDPSGALVAGDDNSAADGRNALLSHAAAVSGTYTVKILPVDRTHGEYVLHVDGYTPATEGPDFAVVSTDLPDGGRFETSPSQVTVQFSEPVLLTSLDASDLTINGLAALAVTVVEGHTITFDLPVILDGMYDIAIAAGSITDVHGSQVDAFTSQFGVGVFDFPVPLEPVDPLGSWIYEGRVEGEVDLAGATRHYRLSLDAGQTLSIAVRGDHSLVPTVTLYDTPDNVIATHSASSLGQSAMLQTVVLTQAGDYWIAVSGGGTTGAFRVDATLNAALEAEHTLGLDNNAIASAQTIDGAFTNVTDSAQRAAVRGSVAGGDEDWYAMSLDQDDVVTVGVTDFVDHDTFVELYDAAGLRLVEGRVADGNLNSVISDFALSTSGTYYIRVTGVLGAEYSLVVTRGAAFDTELNNAPDHAQDISDTGVVLGQTGGRGGLGAVFTVLVDSYGDLVKIDPVTGVQLARTWVSLGDHANAAMARTDETILVGGYTNRPIYELDMENLDLIREIPDPIPYLYGRYKTSMAYLNGVLYMLDSRGDNLYAADYTTGALLSTTPMGRQIHALAAADGRLLGLYSNQLYDVDPTGGTTLLATLEYGGRHLAFVDGELYVSYEDIVHVFDIETFAFVRTESIPVSRAFEVAPGFADDFYSLSVGAGDMITVSTSTPAAGPGEFVSGLDPVIELYAPSGTLVTTDDNSGGDGRNAIVRYSALETGAYTIGVSAVGQTAGEYVLHVDARDFGELDTWVTEITPPDGALVDVLPDITVKFSHPINAATLDASDLAVGGMPSSGVTLVDAHTAVFGTPVGLLAGTHTVALAGGAVDTTYGRTNWAFASELTFAPAPMLVMGIDPANGTLAVDRPTHVTVDFTHPVLPAGVDPSAVSIGGVAAAGFTLVDADTVAFQIDLAALGEGLHDTVIARGAALSIFGQTSEASHGTFTYSLPPRVIASSLDEGQSFTWGEALVYTATFDRDIVGANLDASDFILINSVEAIAPDSFAYAPGSRTLTLTFAAPLVQDTYTLRLLSGDGRIEGVFGLDLDGEPVGANADNTPSGDGVPGGSFAVHFGNAAPPSEIHGVKWYDVNGDGVRDAGEAGLDGWTIELLDAHTGGVVDTQMTSSMDVNGDGTIDPRTESGLYAFTDLTRGEYRVREVTRNDWDATWPLPDGGLTFIETHANGVDGVDGLDSPYSVTVSEDGTCVYATAYQSDAVAVFTRDAATGQLAFVGAWKDGVGGVDGLNGAFDVAVSSDRRHVYVCGFHDNAVAVFAQDPTSNTLSFLQVVRDDVGGVDGLRGVRGLAISPDGAHVYVASYTDDAVAVFSRDIATGRLSFVQVLKDGVGGVDGLDGVYSVVVSPGGENVYAVGSVDDAIVTFLRDPATGVLSVMGVMTDGADGVDGLNGVRTASVTRDGRHVYAGGYVDSGLALFSRDPATGNLTYLGVIKDVDEGVDGLSRPTSVSVAPDGHNVYVVAYTDRALTVFTRNSATGELAFVEMVSTAGSGVYSARVSPDGRNVYTTAIGGDMLTAFSRGGARMYAVTLEAGQIVTSRDFGGVFEDSDASPAGRLDGGGALVGDINGDGRVSSQDRRALRTAYGSATGDESYTIFADLNGDGRVSSRDRRILRDNYGTALPASSPQVLPVPQSVTSARSTASIGDMDAACPSASSQSVQGDADDVSAMAVASAALVSETAQVASVPPADGGPIVSTSLVSMQTTEIDLLVVTTASLLEIRSISIPPSVDADVLAAAQLEPEIGADLADILDEQLNAALVVD